MTDHTVPITMCGHKERKYPNIDWTCGERRNRGECPDPNCIGWEV